MQGCNLIDCARVERWWCDAVGRHLRSFRPPKFSSPATRFALNHIANCPVTPNMPKRKNQSPANGKSKKRAISDDEAHKNFDEGLFDSKRLAGYTKYYAESQPYVDLNIE